MKYKIVAVDFDQTLCFDKFPGVDNINTHAVEVLKKYRERGGKLILWTCRHDKPLEDAVEALRKLGLEFDAVNANIPEHAEQWKAKTGDENFSQKVYADLYIDDKAVRLSDVFGDCGGLDWIAISTVLRRE